jgi:Na+/melibiose symporter-like transporter
MSDLVVLLILVAVVLAYVSVLLYINLGSQGVALPRVIRLLVELWLTFALIIGVLAVVTGSLGPTPAGSIAAELAARLSHWRQLSSGQQAMILGGVVLALVLFAHFIWSYRALQQQDARHLPPSNGGTPS